MEESITAQGYAALLPGKAPDRQEAERLVRQALRRRGEEPWAEMEIEVFPGKDASLVLARPRVRQRVYISLRALQLLLEK